MSALKNLCICHVLILLLSVYVLLFQSIKLLLLFAATCKLHLCKSPLNFYLLDSFYIIINIITRALYMVKPLFCMDGTELVKGPPPTEAESSLPLFGYIKKGRCVWPSPVLLPHPLVLLESRKKKWMMLPKSPSIRQENMCFLLKRGIFYKCNISGSLRK